MKVRVLIVLLVSCLSTVAESSTPLAETIVENYCAASREQAQLVKGASMDMEFEASLPKLKKNGKLHALRRISALGRITYEKLLFEGDNTVRNQIIKRYLQAEAEAQTVAPARAVTPANYKFKYKGPGQLEGRDIHIFQVTPKQKRDGLFKGEVWIDAITFLRVQESGYLVKTDIFLKKAQFVRRYEIRDGVSMLRQVQSTVDTRLLGVGKAELTIDFSNVSIDRTAAAEDGIQ